VYGPAGEVAVARPMQFVSGPNLSLSATKKST
jgi:hypothetical protein